ncbi:MAG: P-type conjugative transfer protein TrbG [Pseudomonadota bacterium]
MTRTFLYKGAVRSLLLMSVAGLATACVQAQQEPPTFTRAVPSEPPVIRATIEPDVIPAFPQVRKPLNQNDETEVAADGLAAIEEAYRDSVIASAPDGFINATQFFAYQPGALYELHAAPGFLSIVQLQPGETLINYALGDTARWIVESVTDGNQPRLLMKPVKAGLSTNLVITTDRRIYVIQAESHKRDTYNAVIAWTYPLDEIATQVEVVEAVNRENADTIVTGVPVDQLNFDYAIKGDKPDWRPVRAFDDGAKVYIEFPRNLGSIEAPPLFLAGEDGGGQLVNYRVKRNYYVVDRLFDLAELRLADTTIQVVKNGAGFSWKRFFSQPTERKSLRRDPDDHGEQHDRAGHHGMDRSHRM